MEGVRTVLVGGPPGAGKTTLTRALGARLGFLATTVDDLVTTARLVTSARSHPDLHRTLGVGHIEYFTDGPPDRLIADATALGDAMWPVLERVIRRHGNDKAPIVMDWWLFDPDKVAAISNDSIRSIWIRIDPDELDRRERRLTDFRGGSSDPERMHANFMARSLWRNQLIAERAAALGLPLIHQPGHRSVDDLTDEALRLLTES